MKSSRIPITILFLFAAFIVSFTFNSGASASSTSGSPEFKPSPTPTPPVTKTVTTHLLESEVEITAPDYVFGAGTNKTIAAKFSDRTNADQARIAEFVYVRLGPIGEAYTVSALNDFIKVDSSRESQFVYPSLIFDMSAAPIVKTVINNKGKEKAQNTDIDLEWRNVRVTLAAVCSDDEHPDKTCDPKTDAIEIMEVLPNKTTSGHKDSLPVQVANALTSVATASAPFFPASTFNEKVTAAGNGLSVLFSNLFPPDTQTYFDAYLANSQTFGWNFKQDHVTAANTSILGVNRGVVLLKTTKEVKKIRVVLSVLSEWDQKIVDSPFNRVMKRGLCLCRQRKQLTLIISP